MKLKQLMAGATIAGALGAAALGVGTGIASAAPGPQPGGHNAPAVNHAAPQDPGGGHGPGGPGGPGGVDPAARVDLGRADPAVTALVDQVDPARADPATTDLAVQVGLAGLADLAITDLAARVTTDQVDLADPADLAVTDPAARVDPAVHGTATTTAATSTTRRGVTDPHLGAPASRRIPTGAGRFPRLEGVGTTGRSITTATTRTRSGTRASTSGASTSSEFGSRCKDSPHQTPASPIGGAGVAHFAHSQWLSAE